MRLDESSIEGEYRRPLNLIGLAVEIARGGREGRQLQADDAAAGRNRHRLCAVSRAQLAHDMPEMSLNGLL